MKATIKQNGTLIIIAENEIEAYALAQWLDQCRRNEVAWGIETSLSGTKMTCAPGNQTETPERSRVGDGDGEDARFA